MLIEVLQGLYFLSNCPDAKQEVDYLKKKVGYLQDPLKPWVEAWIDNYNSQGVFPTFETYMASVPGAGDFLSSCGVNPDVLTSFTPDLLGKYQQTWSQYLGSFEVKHLERLLVEAGSGDEKRKITEKIQALLVRSSNIHDSVLYDSQMSVVDDVRSRFDSDIDGVIWPIDRLNERLSPLQPGIVAGLFGSPASGKSTFAQNMVYLNSIKRPKRSCYFYMEDIPIRYKMNFLSRFSRELEDPDLWISSSVLKRTIKRGNPDSETIVKKMDEIERLYKQEMQGEIIYQSMHGFSNDPIVFGPQLARYCDKHEIDFLVVDHILRFGGFRHPDYPRVEYLNLMMGCLANVAIGQYGNRQLAVMPLAQPNRDGEARGLKTKGHFQITDISDISAMEKDCMIVLAVHSDETMREGKEINTMVLKSRDGGADSQPQSCYFEPAYALIGTANGFSDRRTVSIAEADSAWQDNSFQF